MHCHVPLPLEFSMKHPKRLAIIKECPEEMEDSHQLSSDQIHSNTCKEKESSSSFDNESKPNVSTLFSVSKN